MTSGTDLIGYLIPLCLVAGFILFPALLWLSKADESKKDHQ